MFLSRVMLNSLYICWAFVHTISNTQSGSYFTSKMLNPRMANLEFNSINIATAKEERNNIQLNYFIWNKMQNIRLL